MTDGENRRTVVTTFFSIVAIFTLNFTLNIVWSAVALIVFSFSINSNELIDQIVKSPEFLFFSCIYNVFVIIMTYMFWKHLDKQNTDIIGLKWKKNSLKLFGLGIIGGSLEISLIMLISLGLGTLWFQSSGFQIFSITEMQSSLSYGLLAFILVGFGEEVLFRGYIQKKLMLLFGNKRALFLSSLIFMAAHILTYDYIQVNIVRLQDYEHFKGAVLYIFNNTGDLIIAGVNYGNVIEVSFIIAELIVVGLLYALRNKIRRIASQKF